jgi:hypothetical protein
MKIGFADLTNSVPETLTYPIPGVIPSTAHEVLVYATVKAGWNDQPFTIDLKFFTQIGGIKYEKYLPLVAYHQDAVNTNSDNMWFPMPPDRQFFLYAPATNQGSYNSCVINIIGYR